MCTRPPSPRSHEMVYGENWPPPPLLAVMVVLHILSSEKEFFSTQNRCHMDLWSVWLVLTRHHLYWQQLLLHQNPRERVSWLLSRVSLCLFPVRFLRCQELLSNSYLSINREYSSWVWPLFTWTSSHLAIIENHLIWVDSSLMVPWASLRLLASDNKEQPPLPDHLKNLLIWVDSIKVIPLGFVQYVPWALSRSPIILG